jgi:hypothetical protein
MEKKNRSDFLVQEDGLMARVSSGKAKPSDVEFGLVAEREAAERQRYLRNGMINRVENQRERERGYGRGKEREGKERKGEDGKPGVGDKYC